MKRTTAALSGIRLISAVIVISAIWTCAFTASASGAGTDKSQPEEIPLEEIIPVSKSISADNSENSSDREVRSATEVYSTADSGSDDGFYSDTEASSAGASFRNTSAGAEAEEFYAVGSDVNTFADLYDILCHSIDIKSNPIPEPDTKTGNYGNGQFEYVKVIKDDDDSYEYIGYVCSDNGSKRFIVRNWTGYHKDGSIIGMVVYYQLNGRYLGNIRRDYSSGASTSSHRCPYSIIGEPLVNKD